VIGFLRCIGLLNAAIWFGAGIFFTFGAGPAIFSSDMQKLLEAYYPSYSGMIAQIVIARYSNLGLHVRLLRSFIFWQNNSIWSRPSKALAKSPDWIVCG